MHHPAQVVRFCTLDWLRSPKVIHHYLRLFGEDLRLLGVFQGFWCILKHHLLPVKLWEGLQHCCDCLALASTYVYQGDTVTVIRAS